MIDLHCHLLPGIDDGPPDVAGTLALARAAAAAGTRTIAATPHVDHHFRIDPRIIAASVDAAGRAVREAGIPIAVVPGAEVALSRMPDLDDDALRAGALGGGPYVLLECPLTRAAPGLEAAVADLQRRGHRVLLAHPERAPAVQREPEALARMVRAGALAQVTAGAFTGDFGEPVRRFACRLLREDLVHCVASDAHDPVRRPPVLLDGLTAAAREVRGIEDRAAWYTEEVPAAILAGDAPPAPPPLRDQPASRGLLRRLRRA